MTYFPEEYFHLYDYSVVKVRTRLICSFESDTIILAEFILYGNSVLAIFGTFDYREETQSYTLERVMNLDDFTIHKFYTESKDIAEDENSIQEFAVFFWEDQVFVEEHKLPLGYITTEFLNLTADTLNKLIPFSERMMLAVADKLFNNNTEKTEATIEEIQKEITPYFELILELPLFSLLNLDKALYLELLPAFYKADPKSFKKMTTIGTSENEIMRLFFKKLFDIINEILVFGHYISNLINLYLERLKSRNIKNYATAVYSFFANTDLLNLIAETSPTPYMKIFSQESSVMTQFTTMPNPNNKKDYIIAERVIFHHLIDFLKYDFFRSLSHGHAPRKCQNCQKYFLQTDGYQTVYCENIAPNEKTKTCRQVGAKKAEKEKAAQSPPIKLYNRLYRRLQQRHNRGTITTDEWNEKIALAQGYREQALSGKIEIHELEERYKNM